MYEARVLVWNCYRWRIGGWERRYWLYVPVQAVVVQVSLNLCMLSICNCICIDLIFCPTSSSDVSCQLPHFFVNFSTRDQKGRRREGKKSKIFKTNRWIDKTRWSLVEEVSQSENSNSMHVGGHYSWKNHINTDWFFYLWQTWLEEFGMCQLIKLILLASLIKANQTA